jgi:hypothetical protein
MLHEGLVIGGRLPKGGEMKPCRKTGVFGLILLSLLVCHHGAAAVESGRAQPVQIEKTFDQSTLITHTLKLVQPPHIVSLHVSQRRAAEGSDDIQRTYLRFRYETPEEAPPMTRTEFDALFGELMRALRETFGPHLDLESLGSGGFLGTGDMEKSSALAFRDFAPWATYLENPTTYTQWKIHEIVLERWRDTKVFAPVVAALDRAGYEAELSGFEKLFIFKAKEFKTYPKLEALGIPGHQKFPYPGTIAFSIKPSL